MKYFLAILSAFLLVNMPIIGQSVPNLILDNVEISASELTNNGIGKKITLPHNIQKQNITPIKTNTNNQLQWSYHISVENANGLVAFFDKLILGKNTQIRAYSPISNKTTQQFYKNNNNHTNSFALPIIQGEEMVIEVTFENQNSFDSFEMEMSQVGVIVQNAGFGDAPACFVNVNCEEGDIWQDQTRSVARYMTVVNSEIGWCTGSLINNTNQDCKNYFLSAAHCAFGSTSDDFGQFVFYFNYESPDCNNPDSDDDLDNQTVIGCTKIIQSGDFNGFPSCSDFLLLELTPIPTDYNVYYAGWNRGPLEDIEGNGAIIQHPLADIKKISFWDIATESGSSASHLYVEMIASQNGEGIVEPNSSGSPIFDKNKNIIGNVSNGDSGCISDSSNDPVIAGGGRFEAHWDQCAEDIQLKPWLDPIDSGVLFLEGKNQCGPNGVFSFELEEHQTSVFPNPARDLIKITTKDAVFLSAEFYSITGQQLLFSNEAEVNVANLPKGIIMVFINTDKGVGLKKLNLQ